MIEEYFTKFSENLAYLEIVSSHSLIKKKIDDYSGIIRGKIYFDRYCLDVLEVVFLFNNPKKVKKKYSYHFMDNNNSMIFRYDNAMHYRKISTFPHHKHLQSEVIESTEPNIEIILKEVKAYIERH